MQGYAGVMGQQVSAAPQMAAQEWSGGGMLAIQQRQQQQQGVAMGAPLVVQYPQQMQQPLQLQQQVHRLQQFQQTQQQAAGGQGQYQQLILTAPSGAPVGPQQQQQQYQQLRRQQVLQLSGTSAGASSGLQLLAPVQQLAVPVQYLKPGAAAANPGDPLNLGGEYLPPGAAAHGGLNMLVTSMPQLVASSSPQLNQQITHQMTAPQQAVQQVGPSAPGAPNQGLVLQGLPYTLAGGLQQHSGGMMAPVLPGAGGGNYTLTTAPGGGAALGGVHMNGMTWMN